MFSATKFIVAGVIVALFGGFLLSGVLTQQPSDEPLPAVGASASAQADPSDATTAEPESTTGVEADHTATTPDLLPGVDLVTEEVEPGVFLVLSDGVRKSDDNIWDVAITGDGEVWVERHVVAYRPNAVPRDSVVWRLGRPDELRPSIVEDPSDGEITDLYTDADGRLRGKSSGLGGTLSGESDDACVAARAIDGVCWGWWFGTIVGDDERYDMSQVGLDIGGRDVQLIAASPDGSVWAATADSKGLGLQVATYKNGFWEVLDTPGPPDAARNPAIDPVGMWDMAVGPDGTLWISKWSPSVDRLRTWSWDGSLWSILTPVETRSGDAWSYFGKRHTADRQNGFGGHTPSSGIHFDPDGSIWFDGLVHFDGTTFVAHEVPARGSTRRPLVNAVAYAPDGSLWLTVIDGDPRRKPGCPADLRGGGKCAQAIDGLYVITP